MEAASSRFLRSSVRSTTSPSICSRAPINLTDCILWLFRQFLTHCTELCAQNGKTKSPCLARNIHRKIIKLKKVKLFQRGQWTTRYLRQKQINKSKQASKINQVYTPRENYALVPVWPSSATHLFKVILSHAIKFQGVDSTDTVQVHQGGEYT